MNISSPSLFSARELFPGNRWPSSPLPFPRSAQQPRQATTRAPPCPAADARARLSAPSSPLHAPRNRPAWPQPSPTNDVVGASPLVPRPLQIAARPLARTRLPPRSRFRACQALRKAATAAAEVSELRRPPPREPPSPSRLRSGFHRGEHRRTLPSPPMLFISRFLASRALAASSASHGRRPWRPPR